MPVYYPPTNALPSGSAGAPSVAFAEDANLGFYRASDDYLGFSCSGVASLRFTSGGSILGGTQNNSLQLTAAGGVELVSVAGQDVRVTPNGIFRVAGVTFVHDQIYLSPTGTAGRVTWGANCALFMAGEGMRNVGLIPWGSGDAVLINTTTNSGNGLLQLLSHGSLAGGIAFGTVVGGGETIWRRGASHIGSTAAKFSAERFGIVGTGGIYEHEFGVFNNRLTFSHNYGASWSSLYAPSAWGWGLPTGTLTRSTFDPSTVTLAQLAERVAALITDLHVSGSYHGLLNT